MQEHVARFIRGCMLCCINKPSNEKHGLYHPLPATTHPWEITSMEFSGGLSTTNKGHDYLFTLVDRFSKTCVLIPCKMTMGGKEVEDLFFGQVRVQFWILRRIISNVDMRFLSLPWTTLWEKMDMKLKRSTTLHP